MSNICPTKYTYDIIAGKVDVQELLHKKHKVKDKDDIKEKEIKNKDDNTLHLLTRHKNKPISDINSFEENFDLENMKLILNHLVK